jgi:hypothetical protein
MAPEIGNGTYGKQVDIYAAGILLYEMITGRIPFDGQTPNEIMIKHLTCLPDLQPLPAEYARIVGKALSKDPKHRYASFTEMAGEVEQVGLKRGGTGSPVTTAANALENIPSVIPVKADRVLSVLPAQSPQREQGNLRDRIGELCSAMALAAVIVLFGGIVVWVAMNAQGSSREATAAVLYLQFVPTAVLALLITWVVMVPAKIWEQRRGDPWCRQASCCCAGSAWVRLLAGSTAGPSPPCFLPRRKSWHWKPFRTIHCWPISSLWIASGR